MNVKSEVSEALYALKKTATLTEKQLVTLLSASEESDISLLFETARQVRAENFQNKIYTYGFVYFSSWCRNECKFCYYRKPNKIQRYRKTSEEILEIATDLGTGDFSVHLIDLTMGEDLKYHNEGFASILEIIKEVKKATGLPVMLSPGVVDESVIDAVAAVGCEWYAVYQETYNRELFAKLRINQDYDKRLNIKLYAKSKGLHIEEGLLIGAGESLEDIAYSLIEMGKINATQMRVMTFVPQEGAPLAKPPNVDPILELKVIALLRLLYPKVLIPASLDIEGISGLEQRLNAGANIITSIIPPKSGLMGVAQGHKNVDDGGRTVKGVSEILKNMNLELGSVKEYMDILQNAK